MVFTTTTPITCLSFTLLLLLQSWSWSWSSSINAFAIRPSTNGKVAATSSTLMSLSFRPPLVGGPSTNDENDGNNADDHNDDNDDNDDKNNNHNDSVALGGLKDKDLTKAATVLDIEKLQLIMKAGFIEIKKELGESKKEIDGKFVTMDEKLGEIKKENDKQFLKIDGKFVEIDGKIDGIKNEVVAVKNEFNGQFVELKKEINSLGTMSLVGICSVLVAIISAFVAIYFKS